MASKNAMARLQLGAFAQRANLNIETVVRKAALDILRAIIQRSPVDTGRFRGNWYVQSAIAPESNEDTDKQGAATAAKGADEIARFKVGGHLYILNHLPYSIELENGHSDQAPRGMVKITVREYQDYIRRAAAGLKK